MMTQENTPGPALPARRLNRCALGAGTQAEDVEEGGGEGPLHLDLELLRFHPHLHTYYLCDLREAT